MEDVIKYCQGSSCQCVKEYISTMQIKVLHSVMMMVGCGTSVQTLLMTSLSIWSPLPRKTRQITSLEGNSSSDYIIWGYKSFNPFYY